MEGAGEKNVFLSVVRSIPTWNFGRECMLYILVTAWKIQDRLECLLLNQPCQRKLDPHSSKIFPYCPEILRKWNMRDSIFYFAYYNVFFSIKKSICRKIYFFLINIELKFVLAGKIFIWSTKFLFFVLTFAN